MLHGVPLSADAPFLSVKLARVPLCWDRWERVCQRREDLAPSLVVEALFLANFVQVVLPRACPGCVSQLSPRCPSPHLVNRGSGLLEVPLSPARKDAKTLQ